MAAIPPNFGGDHEFLEDPLDTGTGAAIGDLAALNLQMLHILQPILGPGLEAERVRLAEGYRNALAAAEAFNARENSTRELQPMSRIPNANYGNVNTLAGIRINQLPQFTGESRDAKVVMRWLNRITSTAEAHELTLDATINLMIHASSGSASDFIDRMREEGRTIAEVIRNLELRYGELCAPDEALVKANALVRLPGEDLSSFLDRFRHLARMAKRHIEDNGDRLDAIEALVEANIRRVLPDSVREALDERILARTRMGLPPFTTSDLEKECIELEQRREDRHAKKNQAKARSKQGRIRAVQPVQTIQPAYVNQVYLTGTASASYDSTYPDSYSDYSEEEQFQEDQQQEGPEMQDPGVIAFINAAHQVQSRYQQKGIHLPPEVVTQKAIRRFNKYPQYQPQQGRGQGFDRGRPRQQQAYGDRRPRYNDRPQARQVVAVGPPAQGPAPVPAQPGAPAAPVVGPPNRLPNTPRWNFRDLLARGNCLAGECIRCGQPGHVMSSDACALRGLPLMDRACIRCKKGLHAVDSCLLAFQQPAQPNHINFAAQEWSDDSDDLNGE